MDTNFHSDTRAGTLGGTALVILAQLNLSQILETAVLAAVGAVVSFLVSLALKRLLRRRKKE